MGIVAAGAAIGGLLYPLVMDRLISGFGFSCALRVIAGMLLVIVSLSTLVIRSRLRPSGDRVTLTTLLAPYTESTFLLMTIGAWLMYIGGFIPVSNCGQNLYTPLWLKFLDRGFGVLDARPFGTTKSRQSKNLTKQ
jgi:uncharacterized membrane protein SirB2